MNFSDLKPGQIEYIDLHGLSSFEAEIQLFQFLDIVPKTIKGVEVSHGYRRGTAIKQMVKNQFHHPKIAAKHVGLNPGSTYLLLK